MSVYKYLSIIDNCRYCYCQLHKYKSISFILLTKGMLAIQSHKMSLSQMLVTTVVLLLVYILHARAQEPKYCYHTLDCSGNDYAVGFQFHSYANCSTAISFLH